MVEAVWLMSAIRVGITDTGPVHLLVFIVNIPYLARVYA